MNKEKIELLKDLSNFLEKNLITKDEFENQKWLLLKKESSLDRIIQRVSFLLRMMTPQIVVLVALFMFFSPVNKLIRNASEVAFGDSFSFKVQQALDIKDPELASVVKKLTKEEISALMTGMSGKGLYFTLKREEDSKPELGLDDQFDSYVSLKEKGLFDSKADLAKVRGIFAAKHVNRTNESVNMLRGSLTNKYYLKESFSDDELKLIEQASGFLTPAGERVYWLIVDNAAEELSKS